MIDITPKIFYRTGIYVFLIIGICNLINFFIFYDRGNLFSHIASIGGILFNFLLMGFFNYLYKTQTSSIPDSTKEDLEEALEEFNKNG